MVEVQHKIGLVNFSIKYEVLVEVIKASLVVLSVTNQFYFCLLDICLLINPLFTEPFSVGCFVQVKLPKI